MNILRQMYWNSLGMFSNKKSSLDHFTIKISSIWFSKTVCFSSGAANGEDVEDPVVEVPPPMQPISSLPVAAAASSTSVEQKVKKRQKLF